MSIAMEFDNGVTATFSLNGQTSACHRNIHIMCEAGELIADDETNHIRLRHHVSSQAETFTEQVIHIRTNKSGHGGGDAGILNDFTDGLLENAMDSRSSISRSTESHLMAFAMEESRLTGTVVDLEQYKNTLM